MHEVTQVLVKMGNEPKLVVHRQVVKQFVTEVAIYDQVHREEVSSTFAHFSKILEINFKLRV